MQFLSCLVRFLRPKAPHLVANTTPSSAQTEDASEPADASTQEFHRLEGPDDNEKGYGWSIGKHPEERPYVPGEPTREKKQNIKKRNRNPKGSRWQFSGSSKSYALLRGPMADWRRSIFSSYPGGKIRSVPGPSRIGAKGAVQLPKFLLSFHGLSIFSRTCPGAARTTPARAPATR